MIFRLSCSFLRLLDVLTAFSTSIGVELLGFLDIDRFLFLLFASNKVDSFLTNGYHLCFWSSSPSWHISEPSVLKFLILKMFWPLRDNLFHMSLWGPSLQIPMWTEVTFVYHHIVLGEITSFLPSTPCLCPILFNSDSTVEAGLKNC